MNSQSIPHHRNRSDFLKVLEQRITENKSASPPPRNMIYRLMAENLGIAPWRVIIPLSLAFGFGLVALLGDRAIRGVSLLQWGF